MKERRFFRRDFIKTAGLATAALALARIDNLPGRSDTHFISDHKKGGLDLADPANAAILSNWGYLNVISYGADPTGTNDSTAAIQSAIDAGFDQIKGVLFPSGTYIISDSLRCEKLWPVRGGPNFPRKNHILVGEENNGIRPVIKLAQSAPGFDDSGKPKAMIVYIHYQMDGTNPRTIEQLRALDPITMTQGTTIPAGGVVNCTADIFDEVLRDVDFDCSEHSGAVGVFYGAAQKSIMFNVKVNATNAHTGVWGIPGRNSGAVNIEVQGGRIGLKLTSSEAGSTVVGLKLHGQTEQAIVSSDFCPACIVGFDIKMNKVPFITISTYTAQTVSGTIALIDGTLESTVEGTLISNTSGKSIYARNVYVKGSGSFTKCGSQSAVGGSGTWFRIAEYCCTDQYSQTTPYASNVTKFNTFSIINGVKNQKIPVEPVITVQNDATPTADIINRHLYSQLPQVSFRDSSKTINVTEAPYNAVADTRDNWASIQQAIDDANADGKVVLIPQGTFLISKSLVLKANTRLLGLGCKRLASNMYSVISAHSSFQKISGNEALITTVDDAEAQTYLSGFNLISTANVVRHIHWRAGRKSTMMNLSFGGGTVVETTVYFSGNGGGRHYLLEPQTSYYNANHRHIRTIGTTQPLSWYGCNLEAQVPSGANAEFVNSHNIRIYGIKREGVTPTMIIDSCTNVAVDTHGALRESLPATSIGYTLVKGTSNGILMSLMLVQTNYDYDAGQPFTTFKEAVTGQPEVSVVWPDGISVYKRGEIDDSKMYVSNPGGTLIKDNKIPGVNIYPNPTDGIINIVGINNIDYIRLFDIKGNVLGSWSAGDLIDISNHNSGIYILKIEDQYGISTHQRIIKR